MPFGGWSRGGQEEERGQTLLVAGEGKFLPAAAAAKKQKLLPKIAGSAEGDWERGSEEGTAIKGGQKFSASFSECSCVKVAGRVFGKWRLCISLSRLSCQFHAEGREEAKPDFSKRKKKVVLILCTPTLEQTYGVHLQSSTKRWTCFAKHYPGRARQKFLAT